MKRRKFVQSIGAITAAAPFVQAMHVPLPPSREDLLAIFVAKHDKRVERILQSQERRKDHPNYGAFPNIYGIATHGTPAAHTQSFIAAYVSPGSKYYKSPEVAEALDLAMKFLLKVQHPDGNIDLLTTNFQSPPDTAFASEPMGLALTLLQKYLPEELADFQEQAEQFLQKGGEAMRIGGLHTPNHRWVMCRALARINSLFPNRGLIDRIEEWLAEGIDIDPDGQYTEKSSVVYSPITNESFITTARLTGMNELYEPVRKNLEMTQYFVHANGEVVTEASRRQDQFQIAKMGRYYYAYRYMALMDKNTRFSAMTKLIEDSVGYAGVTTNLAYMLEDPTFLNSLPRKAKLSTSYAKHFPHSTLARIRRGKVDATILGNNYIFFTFFKGNAALQAIRLASAFFGKGQFTSPSLKIEDGKYILTQDLEGPYYQPFPTEILPDDGDWHKMPRYLRPQSEVQYFRSTITITEDKGVFSVHFDIRGTDRVPLAIELAFRPGGKLTGVKAAPNVEKAYLLEEGHGKFEMDGDTIEFGPGHAKHGWTQLRGAKPKLNGDSVYLTGYTPFDFTLEVK